MVEESIADLSGEVGGSRPTVGNEALRRRRVDDSLRQGPAPSGRSSVTNLTPTTTAYKAQQLQLDARARRRNPRAVVERLAMPAGTKDQAKACSSADQSGARPSSDTQFKRHVGRRVNVKQTLQ